MRLVTYLHEGRSRIGVQLFDWVIDLAQAYQSWLHQIRKDNRLAAIDEHAFEDMLALLKCGEKVISAAREAISSIAKRLSNERKILQQQGIAFTSDDVILLPPILCPGKIICVGMNYPEPGSRGKPYSSKYPVLFHKVASTLVGDGHPIVIPPISKQTFSEGELVVVIGQRGKYIERTEALSYVAGYTIANDVGDLILEQRTSQWATGKMLDTFCPMGPALVTQDEVGNPNNLHIQTKLNGKVVQSGNTQEMIFDVPYLINYISNLTTLEPGDLILTGSPKGIGDASAPTIFMKPGDIVSIEIEKLGTLTNYFSSEE